jgi:hypothetical protein
VSVFYDDGTTYSCEILDQAMTVASTGNPQFVLRFRVITYANGDPVTKQYERTFYRVITEKTTSYLQEDLGALGFTGDNLRQLDPNVQGSQDFTGKQVDFYCSHEENLKGEMRERWSIARGPKPIKGDPVPESTYRRLDALFGFKPAPAAAATVRDEGEADIGPF